MRGCPYCQRTNCIYAWQAPGTPVPAGVPIVDVPASSVAGPQVSAEGLGFPTAKDWLGGIVACLQGALAGAATGAAVGGPWGALIGGVVGCGAGVGAYLLAQMVAEEQQKKQEEFAAQQSAMFQAQIAEQKKQLESGLSDSVGGLPTWIIPAALAIVGVGFLARKKRAST